MNSARGRIGRPPGPHDDTLQKLLPAARRLFIEEGGAALTPTRLHTETGVARATIYRNWPEPADLIEILLAGATEQPPDDAFGGEPAEDLHRAADLLRLRFDEGPVRPFVAACLEYGRTSDRVAVAAEDFIASIFEPFDRVLRAAVETGAVNGDVEALVSELAGPLVVDHVLLGRPLPQERVQEVVDHFLDHHLVVRCR